MITEDPYKIKGCDFCEMDQTRIIDYNELSYCIRDDEPITHCHTLIISNRHAPTYFDLNKKEVKAIFDLLVEQKKAINNIDSSVDGFNIIINNGQVAGQTISHCHIHLIPRRKEEKAKMRNGALLYTS